MKDLEKVEPQRERVRRLVIRPLMDAGMRFPARTEGEKAAQMLNRICDELSYARDETLQAVCAWAKVNGQGSARSFFPPVIGFIGTAHTYQPRDLEEIPVVASWFQSRAGVAARDAGRLVAEFCFIQKQMRPPQSDRDRKAIRDKGMTHQRRVELATDRINRGVEPGQEERRFLDWYQQVEQRALVLVNAGEDKRRAERAKQ